MLFPFDESVAVCLDDSDFGLADDVPPEEGVDPHPPSASAVMHRQAESALRMFMVFHRPIAGWSSWSGQ
jgi:hypothetical protein